MALQAFFSLISLIFLSFLNSGRSKQRDSRLHSFSLSNHSLNLFKRTWHCKVPSYAHFNFRDSFCGLSHRSLNKLGFLSYHSHCKWELWNYVGLVGFCSSAPFLPLWKQLCVFVRGHNILYSNKLTWIRALDSANALRTLFPLSEKTWLLIITLAWETCFFSHTALAPG